jgi:hypothetical protein
LKGIDDFNATQHVSTSRFNTVQQFSIWRFNIFQCSKRQSVSTPPQFVSIRSLLANATIIGRPKLAGMDSESKIERRIKLGGGRAYRSRLESFVEFIREQRQQRRTWQEIATLLRTEKDCAITFQGLHQFYRRYMKRQARPHWESEVTMVQPATVKPQPPARKTVLAATPVPRPFRQPSSDNIKLNDPTNL